jgi:hypothetical protein
MARIVVTVVVVARMKKMGVLTDDLRAAAVVGPVEEVAHEVGERMVADCGGIEMETEACGMTGP